MFRVAAIAVAFALFLGPFGLGAASAWAHDDGNAMSHHGDGEGHGPGDNHPSHEGLAACPPSACAPAVTTDATQHRTKSRLVEQLLWGIVDEQALYSSLSKQDPPVPRFGA
jgi:hypothetical protein